MGARSCWRSRSRARARYGETLPDAVQIFIRPPGEDALRDRLVGRGTDDAEQIERRLRVAEQELGAASEFQHVVVNDRLDEAVDALAAIVRATLDP